MFVVYLFLFVQDSYERRAIVYSQRSLDILAPRVTEQERLSLRAEFRSIERAAAFYAFDAHIHRLADQTGVRLPAFAPVR